LAASGTSESDDAAPAKGTEPVDADEDDADALAGNERLSAAREDTESLLDGDDAAELDWTAGFSAAITNESSAHVGRRRCRSDVRAVAAGAAAASGSATLAFSFLTETEAAGDGTIAVDAAASRSVACKMTGVATRADGRRKGKEGGAAAPADSADEADELSSIGSSDICGNAFEARGFLFCTIGGVATLSGDEFGFS
jgi:hypothetical protein